MKGSGQAIGGTGEQAAELELVGASGFGGGKVGIGPVAADGVHFLIETFGFGAITEVVVICQKAGQIAEFRLGASGGGALSGTVGTEGQAAGEDSVAKLVDIGQLHGLVRLDRGGVFADLVGVSHGNANRGDSFVGPDRVK